MAEGLILGETPKVVVADRKLVLPGDFTEKDRKLTGLPLSEVGTTIKWTAQGRIFVPAQ